MRSNVKVYQKKIVERRRKRALWISAAYIALLAAMVAGLSWLSRVEATEISRIRIEGNERVSDEAVASVAEEEMAGAWLGLFSKKNALLAPEGAVAERLAALPQALSVDVDVKGLHELAIYIEERQEEARFCQGPLGDFSSCYSVDGEGFIFDRAAEASDAIAYRDDREGDPLAGAVIEPAQFKNLQFFAQELSSMGLPPREIELREAAYMTVVVGEGGRLIVNRADNLSKTLGNLASLLERRDIVPSAAELSEGLDYMRLDSGNKIFYKLKE